MMKILVPTVFAILVFLFLGIILYITKYKRKNEAKPQDKVEQGCGCCSDSSCCSD
jgi:hypothetical protein